ncbi:probable serine carboxypeptidase CPVL [Stegodyphus dumicola]|uniref:probable serine carboxypeptidase CPVL n=1 Tax=Stegodyphus dumicola TaxID=202533 RepID=UPI0015ADAD99|nr:probable serine carboxypeptidase CPVL [Stegodyphus dumicola]
MEVIAIVTGLFLVYIRSSISYQISRANMNAVSPNEPLILTPYIESGDIELARNLSKTRPLPAANPHLLSYSGFFTVRKEYDSNIFFWFFPALNGDEDSPIILWLQGGPGFSGMFGFFVEHGPYVLKTNTSADFRPYNWASTFQMIYVDNPVGTGFSFTLDDRGYVKNQEEMADDMYEFLQQFFTVFPEYRDNDFYVAGESYAGKYVPSLAYKIHTMGTPANFKFKGMSVGNGMCDPETMMDYGDYLYNIGLVDEIQAKQMKNLSNSIVNHIRKKDYYEALVEMDKLIINFQLLPYTSLFKNFTGFDFYYNFFHSEAPEDFNYFYTYVELPEFKKALHVGNLKFQNGSMAQKYLLLDIMQSVKSKVAVIMDNYRVLFYNGQLDVIIPYPLTVNFLKTVKWKHSVEYREAKRTLWKLNGKIAGYVHSVENFHEILVRNAGHILPYDQPEVALDLITRFVKNKQFS